MFIKFCSLGPLTTNKQVQRFFCSLRCGRRKISGEGEGSGDKKFPLSFLLFPHLLQMDVCWLTMTLCNTAEGLFEAPLKTIYIPFRYLTSGELWSSPLFQESFRLAIIRRNRDFELHHCRSGRGQGVAGGVLHWKNLGEVLSLCQNFQERLSLSNNCTALVIKCEETQVGRMEMVIQRFLGFLGLQRILGNICSFEWLVALV